jgi:hypothetical protein
LFIPQQLDESTDVANVAQNFIFNRYAHSDVKEWSYFCKPPESATTGRDSKKRLGEIPKKKCYTFLSVTVFVFLGRCETVSL